MDITDREVILMPNAVDLIGQKFGRLFVIQRSENRNRRATWLCICECGNKTVVRSDSLRCHYTESCGCLQRGINTERCTTHGESESLTYRTWKAMKQRCENPKNERHKYYGGRGITICERWNKFENFLEDMGKKPSPKHSIERMDVNGNYEPDNCKWATVETQSKNRRDSIKVTIEGETKVLKDWSRRYGIPYSTLRYKYEKNNRDLWFLAKEVENNANKIC